MSTKERLTGALLVLLALVIVVPEFLPGRHAGPAGTPAAQNPEDGAPLQTFNVQLDATSSPPAVVQDVPAATAARIESVPPPVPPATSVAPPPAAAAPAAAKPASVAAPAHAGQWWVQLGSFGSRDNADRLAKKLRSAGFQIEVSQSRTKGKELYRVRAGPAPDKDAATTLQARLTAAGEKNSSLVAP